MARFSRRAWVLQSLVGASVCLSSFANAQNREPPTPRQRLQELINNASSPLLSEIVDDLSPCTIFARLLKLSELASQLDAFPDISVFIPLDEYWPSSLNLTEVNKQAAHSLVMRHVIDKRWSPASQDAQNLTTIGGVNISLEGVQINQIRFALQGIRIRNGYFHLIRGVL